jgi:crotonobetainyl-CoA:carnitine CoA-transferase CaiB-like acyl-CoA transferase
VLLPLLRQITVFKSTREWIAILERCGVPCGPINDLAAVFADPHVVARQLQLDLPHPFGRAPGIASPIRLSATPVAYRRPPPTLGQHTCEVLQELLLLSEAEIAELRVQGCL